MNNKIEFNDTPELRGFASEKFTWILDKESGISCCWGKTAKENPPYDEIGPEILNWTITQQFDLNKYIKYFNFLTNIQIKNEENNEVVFCEENNYNKLLKIKQNLICMSTFGNIIFNIPINLLINNFKNIEKFFNYIKIFNINPKLIIEYNNNFTEILNLVQNNIKQISKLTTNIILKINPIQIITTEILNLYNIFQSNNILSSLQIAVTNDNYGQVKNLLTKISSQISITLNFNYIPFVTLQKYLKIQNFCKENNLTNVFITQCSKKHFSKRVIGTILHEIECPATRFSIHLKNNIITPCEFNNNIIFDLNTCKSIHDFWSSNEFTKIKNNLIFNGICNNGEIKK